MNEKNGIQLPLFLNDMNSDWSKPHFNINIFLQEYEKYPCLWDPTDIYFKDRLERAKAEQELMKITGIYEVRALKRKIRSIRGSYNNEVRKIKQKRGSVFENEYVPKLSWFSLADKFLRRITNTDLPEHNILEIDDYVNDQSCENDQMFDQSDDTENGIEASSASPASSVSIENQQTIKRLRPIFPKPQSEMIINNAAAVQLRPIQQVSLTSSGINEFVAFGNLIAAQLQQLPLEISLQLQSEIQSLITRRRMNVLHEARNNSYGNGGQHEQVIQNNVLQHTTVHFLDNNQENSLGHHNNKRSKRNQLISELVELLEQDETE